jgi:hypothetical protein
VPLTTRPLPACPADRWQPWKTEIIEEQMHSLCSMSI